MKGLLALLLMCAVGTHVPAQSVQDSLAADTTHQMREVAVVARLFDDSIVPSQRLDGKRLEALSAFSVADAVRYFAGVQLKDYGGVGGLKTLDIRSMGSNHMGVFYDGLQLGNAQNGQIDLGRFSLDNVESISLYNGQKSDIFQPARDFGASGTIYIRTRRPRFAEGERRHLRATMKGGSFGLANPSLLWEERWSVALTSSLSAEYVTATGRYPFRYRKRLPDGTLAWDTTATRQNGDIESLRLEASLFGRLHEGTWTAKAYYYDSERGIPGAIVNNVWKHWQRQWDRNFFVQGSMKQRRSERYEYQVSAKYARDFMHYLNPDTTLMYIDNHFTQREFYVSTAHHVTLTPAWEANFSADYQWNGLEADLVNFVQPRRHSLLVAAASSFEVWRFKLMASVLGTHIFEEVHRGGAAKPDNTVKYTPAAFINFFPLRSSHDLSLRAFYKRIFRLPTFNDLYYTDIGNIALRPENTTQWDAGLLYQHDWRSGFLRHVETKADAYLNFVDNKIIAVPKGSGQYRWMMMNLGKVEIRGLDLTAQTTIQPHRDLGLTLCANYTYQRAEDKSDPTDNDPYMGTYGGQIAYIPRHSGSATGNLVWDIAPAHKNAGQLGLNYSFIYTGERYHNSANIPANHEQPWYTSDVGVTYEWRPPSTSPQGGRAQKWVKSVRLALECNNVFDQQYDVVLNYPMPGRNWKAILKVEM